MRARRPLERAVLPEHWPPLPYPEWRATRDTLHMATQVVGKLRLALSPFEPEWGNVPLYVSARGLVTSPMPWRGGTVEVELDLLGQELWLRTNQGRCLGFALRERPVADFYREFTRALAQLGLEVELSTLPSEIPDPIAFPDDTVHQAWDAAAVQRFFLVLSHVNVVLKQWRARFRGRTTPVQFYWGTFDLAVTRFSGRPAAPPPNSDTITRMAFDAELIEAGWWPGDPRRPEPAFFVLPYPPQPGIESVDVGPGVWDGSIGAFVMPYEAARKADSPTDAILGFLDRAYAAAAARMGWDPALLR